MSQHDPSRRERSQNRHGTERSSGAGADDSGDTAGSTRSADPDGVRLDSEALAAQVDVLADENARLREKYAAARRSRYRKTAFGLGTVGLVAVAGGVVAPAARDVLLILGAIGLFGGLLTAVLTSERFVAASVGERVYGALAANHAALIDELGLRAEPRYLPGVAGIGPRVFVPQRTSNDTPVDETGPIVTADDRRGLLLEPTGAGLYATFRDGSTADPTGPGALAAVLAEAVVEQFELADRVTVDADENRITAAVSEPAFGPIDRFDHPIPSLFAVGLAMDLDRPVRLTVYPADDRADWLVTCWWEAPSESAASDATETAASGASERAEH
ncbi:hypothetical protein [Halovivax cerinus]|uniref:DUF7982 domain-containing protein n=1 Tax=Halovivax cerinus TaxID=1487865 RepID=A0ABD5NRU9_9EURY|nr:hypothetical protein [Halovivax cerinus]